MTKRAPPGLTVVPSGESVVKQMFFEMMMFGYIDLKSSTTTHGYTAADRMDIAALDRIVAPGELTRRDPDPLAVRPRDEERVDVERGAAVEAFLERKMGHGRQVRGPVDRPKALEHAQGELGVLEAVLHHALMVGLPLLGDVAPVDVHLLVAEQDAGDELERFLLRSKVASDRPPGVGDDAAGDPPDALAHDAGFAPFPSEGELFHPEGLGPLDQERDVVASDVVARDDVRVLVGHDLLEPLEDGPLVRVAEHEGRRFSPRAVDQTADRVDRTLLDRVLDIKGKDAQGGTERFRRTDVPTFAHHDPDHPALSVDLGDLFRFVLRLELYGEPQSLVVEEPMDERDIARQNAHPVVRLPIFLAILRDGPRVWTVTRIPDLGPPGTQSSTGSSDTS